MTPERAPARQPAIAITRLRAAGFTAPVIRSIVNARIEARLAQIHAETGMAPPRPTELREWQALAKHKAKIEKLHLHEGETAAARGWVERLDIKPTDVEFGSRFMSGGNKQKVVVAREMSFKPRLLMAAQPASALDIETEFRGDSGSRKGVAEALRPDRDHRGADRCADDCARPTQNR